MKVEVCGHCAGEKIDAIKSILKKRGHDVEVTGCLGMCAKYGGGRINLRIGEREISVECLEELEDVFEMS